MYADCVVILADTLFYDKTAFDLNNLKIKFVEFILNYYLVKQIYTQTKIKQNFTHQETS